MSSHQPLRHLARHLSPLRIALATAAVSLLAFPASAAADQDSTGVTGTLSAGSLITTAPSVSSFTDTLTGRAHTVTTDVGTWVVNDATGSGAGYNVTVEASTPKVDGVDLTGASVSLAAADAPTSPDGLGASEGPTNASGPFVLTSGPQTVTSAAAGKGMGEWRFAQGAGDLSLLMPADTPAGAFSTTLLFTTTPLA
jgi:hypothetical protein